MGRLGQTSDVANDRDLQAAVQLVTTAGFDAHLFGLRPFRRDHDLVPAGLWDHDFHPDEADVRIFVNPPDGVRRRDEKAVVTEALYGDLVLRHYAFADRWFKINVTIDLDGRPTEQDGSAFNCDIATPMQTDGVSICAVDLFLDVLVDATGRSFDVTDRDQFVEAVAGGLVSEREAAEAERHLRDLVALIRQGGLIRWLDGQFGFGPTSPPPALPTARGPVTAHVAVGKRPSW